MVKNISKQKERDIKAWGKWLQSIMECGADIKRQIKTQRHTNYHIKHRASHELPHSFHQLLKERANRKSNIHK